MPLDDLVRLIFRTQERIDRDSGGELHVTFSMAPKRPLLAAAPALLDLAKTYASECGECAGTRVMPDDEPCTKCKDIWRVIDRAEGRT